MFRLKEENDELAIVLNGGVTDVDTVAGVLPRVDGVMIGRQAYHDPYFLARLEQHLDPTVTLPDRREIVRAMLPYIENELSRGERLGRITRHMLGLFAGEPGARAWRRYLSENAFREGAGTAVLLRALDRLPVAA